MRVFNRGTVTEHGVKHPDAAQAPRAWYAEAKRASWGSMVDVRRQYPSADRVGDRIVFDIKGNHYRLIVAFDFPRKSLFIKWFGTHAEYDEIDVATVEYAK